MKNNLSKLSYYLFKKDHQIIGNEKLFRFQSDFTKFAITIPNTAFFNKTSEGIRPFVNQQLKLVDDINSKPIRNHFETYSKIVVARFKELRGNITKEELESTLQEFHIYFSKEPIANRNEKVLFVEVTVEMLQSLRIVAIANGGKLTQEEFMKAFHNLNHF